MLRKTLPCVLGILAIAGSASASAVTARTPAAAVSHSGVVTSIDPASGTLILEEIGPWTGPATRPVSLSISLTPTTTVELVQRSPVAQAGGWPGGYVDSSVKPADVHPGQFATVSTVRDGARLVARSIEVVRPSGD